MGPTDPRTDPLDVLKDGPAATILVVLLNVVGGLVVVLGRSDSLDFEKYLTLGIGSAAVLSVGRGLAAKGDVLPGNKLVDRFNSVPWATVLVYLYALVGGLVLLLGGTDLDFDKYLTLVLGAGGVLGVGRGLAQNKKDRDPLLKGDSDPGFLLAKETAALADEELDGLGVDRPEEEADQQQQRGMPPGMADPADKKRGV